MKKRFGEEQIIGFLRSGGRRGGRLNVCGQAPAWNLLFSEGIMQNQPTDQGADRRTRWQVRRRLDFGRNQW